MVTNWLAELDGRRVTVEVPATSANLGAGYDCVALALGLAQSGRGRGSRLEPRRDRADRRRRGRGRARRPIATNRCVQGIEAALREVRGEIPEGVGWRIEMRNEIPLARGPRVVRGGDGRRARGRQRAARRAAHEPPTCSGSRPRSRATRTTPRPRCSAGSRSPRRRRRRRRGAPVRRAARPAGRAVHPGAAPLDRRHAGRAARPRSRSTDAVANLTRVAIGVAGMATGRFDLLRVLTVDRLHEPYRAKASTRSCRSSSTPPGRPARSAPACRAPARRSSRSPTRSGRSPGSKAAFGAASADTDLPGRIEVVSPRNHGRADRLRVAELSFAGRCGRTRGRSGPVRGG